MAVKLSGDCYVQYDFAAKIAMLNTSSPQRSEERKGKTIALSDFTFRAAGRLDVAGRLSETEVAPPEVSNFDTTRAGGRSDGGNPSFGRRERSKAMTGNTGAVQLGAGGRMSAARRRRGAKGLMSACKLVDYNATASLTEC
jgi:hypothetical protein